MTSLKAVIDKIDIDKLKNVLADLNKRNNVVDNDVVEKTVHDKLAIKLNSIKLPSTGRLVFKMQYDSDKQSLKKKIDYVNKKIPNTSGMVKSTDYNTKVTKVKNKKPIVRSSDLNVKGLGTENKIPDITDLATKASLDTKATKIELKYLILVILLFNRLTKISFDARMKEAGKSLASKTEINIALLI